MIFNHAGEPDALEQASATAAEARKWQDSLRGVRAEKEAQPSEIRPKPTTLDRAALLETLSNLQARKNELATAFQQVVGAEGVILQLLESIG